MATGWVNYWLSSIYLLSWFYFTWTTQPGQLQTIISVDGFTLFFGTPMTLRMYLFTMNPDFDFSSIMRYFVSKSLCLLVCCYYRASWIDYLSSLSSPIASSWRLVMVKLLLPSYCIVCFLFWRVLWLLVISDPFQFYASCWLKTKSKILICEAILRLLLIKKRISTEDSWRTWVSNFLKA